MSHGQAKTPLTQYIGSLKWDAAKRGPLVALGADRVFSKVGASDLKAFRRQLAVLKGISAIVPSTMTVIDDNPKESPSLIDRLPREAQVLFLLSTLDASQWKSVTGSGLSLDDLSPDQKPVFESILPNPFTIIRNRIDANGAYEMPFKPEKLSSDDRQKVKLRVSRSLQIMAPLVDGSRGMVGHNTATDQPEPGDKIVTRYRDGDYNRPDSLGVTIKHVVENQIKISELDYRASALRREISLLPVESVSSLLHRIGVETGLEIHSDIRVADQKVFSIGAKATATGLLQAIALSVTGTYRRVGPAYALTSDLMGLGARKLRFATMDQSGQRKIWNQEAEWRSAIQKSGVIKDLKFDPDSALSPSPEMEKKIDSDDPKVVVNESDLSPGLSKFIDRMNRMYKTQQVKKDGLQVHSELSFGFISPGVEDLQLENQSLGQFPDFSKPHPPFARPQFPMMPGPFTLPATGASVQFRVESIEQARAAMALAKEFGFKSAWISTEDRSSLVAAIESGIPIHLVVKPFASSSDTEETSLDRTILGDSPAAAFKKRRALVDPANPLSFPKDTIAPVFPNSPGFRARCATIVELARTNGLMGIVLQGTTTAGYEGEHSRSISYPEPYFHELGNFGYSIDLRLAFIRKYSIDPIDLVPPNLYSNADLRQPFFLDDNLRGSYSIYDGTDEPDGRLAGLLNEWTHFLANTNRAAVSNLLDHIVGANPSLAILIAPRDVTLNQPVPQFETWLRWKSGDPLPEKSQINQTRIFDPEYATLTLPLTAPENGLLAAFLSGKMPQKLPPITIDASTLTNEKIAQLLKLWFR